MIVLTAHTQMHVYTATCFQTIVDNFVM